MDETRDSATSRNRRWGRLDEAGFGIVYGAIMVLSILLAESGHDDTAFQTAAILFGSVLTITLAKAFAEMMDRALRNGERIDRYGWRTAWHHSAPTLATANVPTLLFIACGLGWLSREQALWMSQGLCVALLIFIGARAGWVLDQRVLPAALGALFAGFIGLLLSITKYLIH